MVMRYSVSLHWILQHSLWPNIVFFSFSISKRHLHNQPNTDNLPQLIQLLQIPTNLALRIPHLTLKLTPLLARLSLRLGLAMRTRLRLCRPIQLLVRAARIPILLPWLVALRILLRCVREITIPERFLLTLLTLLLLVLLLTWLHLELGWRWWDAGRTIAGWSGWCRRAAGHSGRSDCAGPERGCALSRIVLRILSLARCTAER